MEVSGGCNPQPEGNEVKPSCWRMLAGPQHGNLGFLLGTW